MKTMWLPPTVSLPLLNMIDMFSVSLVVPLLHQYYISAGVTSASQRELLSSLFSSSQIVGGLLIGAASDSKMLSRRNTLLLSFSGSAVAYALIMRGSILFLLCSRVVVGLVKQTQTVSTAMLASYTTKENRTIHMGRLKASTTLAWIAGPSIGAYLYKHVDEFAPAALACAMFVLNTVLASIILPRDDGNASIDIELEKKMATNSSSKFASFSSNIRSCFDSKLLGSVVSSLLLFNWVSRATSYSKMPGYYKQMYGIEPYQRGYLSSYEGLLSLIAQSFLVRPLLRLTGGEQNAAFCAGITLSIISLLESQSSFWVFLFILSPIISVSVSLLALSLMSLVTQVAPNNSIGSVLAAIDVLQSAAAVTVPFYRTLLFTVMAKVSTLQGVSAALGEPNPQIWLLSCGTHWLLFAAITFWLLVRGNHGRSRIDQNHGCKNYKEEK